MSEKSIRAQPMVKLEMCNGSTTWIKAETKANMDKIYEFLEKRFEGRFLGTGQLTFSYSTIARHTKIHRNRVSFACNKLSFLKKPVTRTHARRRVSKKGVRTYEGVELIRRIPAPKAESEDLKPTDHPTK